MESLVEQRNRLFSARIENVATLRKESPSYSTSSESENLPPRLIAVIGGSKKGKGETVCKFRANADILFDEDFRLLQKRQLLLKVKVWSQVLPSVLKAGQQMLWNSLTLLVPRSVGLERILFIHMEYCGGETLRKYIDDCHTNLFAEILNALGYIHRQGMIHRDVKPLVRPLPKVEQGRQMLYDRTGVVFFEMCYHQIATGMERHAIINKVENYCTFPADFEDGFSMAQARHIRILICNMLRFKAELRPSVEEIMRDSLVSLVDYEDKQFKRQELLFGKHFQRNDEKSIGEQLPARAYCYDQDICKEKFAGGKDGYFDRLRDDL
ncbi:unnamed protein product, partial [Strongylus vulgaris]